MNGGTAAPLDIAKWHVLDAGDVVSPGQRPEEVMMATLFLLTTATGLLGVVVLHPVLDVPDYLTSVFPKRSGIALGAVLLSITSFGVVFIAVLAFPVLRKLNETMAIAYLSTRIFGSVVMTFGIAAILVLIPLSEMYIEAGAPTGSPYEAIGEVLLNLKYVGLTQLSLPLLSFGGLLFCWQTLRYALVPGPILVVGFAGYGIVLVGGIASWFGVVDATPFSEASFLAIPLALFEVILLPFWLLSVGFTMPKPGSK